MAFDKDKYTRQLMDGFAKITQKTSFAIRGMQSGSIQTYIVWYFLGAVLLAGITWICIF